MNKKYEIMNFLHENVFDPVLTSNKASNELKKGVRATIMRLNKLGADKICQYYWSAIVGTERSTQFAKKMKEEGFKRFEETIDEFRNKFSDNWIKK